MADQVYDPIVVEKKWQAQWSADKTNEIDLASAKNPYYVLMMFPYPSAEGLHVGNVYAFTGADVFSRHRRLRGYDVFEPIGFDAFGIHSENFAMKVNRHPSELIPSNIRNFTRQLESMGFMFDWRRTVDTTTAEYYKWTQWVFLKLYKAGLAYRDVKEVNYCPECGTVIADEQVIDGYCERHGDTLVQRRKLPCWFFKITDFADRLVDNHEWLDWSERTKKKQVEWVGKSMGAEVDFQIQGQDEKIRVYTTRPDTLFGATFMVVAPDHPVAAKFGGTCEQEGGMGVPPMQRSEIDKRRGANLPHWTAENACYSVTFRLGDSLPKAALDFMEREREAIVLTAEQNNRDLSEDEQRRLDYLYSDKIEEFLDAGEGACLLRKEENAKIVQDALLHFDGDRYVIHAWNVMPNHVHVLVQPSPGHELKDILHSWKSFTAHAINKKESRTGALWQSEYFDHLIRNEASFERSKAYIWENSDKAGLKQWPWRGGDAALHGRDAHATLPPPKPKTGTRLPVEAINPVTGAPIPVFASDYVLMGYGTGAIMAVPAHDERDFEFAGTYDLPIVPVIEPDPEALKTQTPDGMTVAEAHEAIMAGKLCWSGPGRAVNSANAEVSLDGLDTATAKAKMIEWLEAKNLGTSKTTFRLRDWGISRQRYWGPPIPIIYDEDGNAHPVPEDQLPVMLPETKDFRPKGDGRGPLANIPEWYNTTLPDGRPGRRETDVMDNFLDSAWYFLRYISTGDKDRPYDPELLRKWLPVDIYIGGNEHAVLHLMYTRFICMALHKAGVLDMGPSENNDPAEPFKVFRAHGLIVKEGAKMSKSKGNIVNPDQYVEQWGADTLRLYLMFLGPYLQGGDFRDDQIQGPRRFLNRLYAWYTDAAQPVVPDEELPKDLRVKTHQTIRKVREDIDALSYNTAISAIMELHNAAKPAEKTSRFLQEAIILCLAPFAPHFAEEIWRGPLGNKESIWTSGRYPEFDESLTKLDEVEIVLQFKGKIRDRVVVAREATEDELRSVALANEKIRESLAGAEPRKLIIVPGRLVNVIG